MLGALEAVTAETGWDPRDADTILGTSAGAMLGTLLAGGLTPAEVEAHADDAGRLGRVGTHLRPHWSFPRPVLASPALALRSLREPWRYGPAGIVAWLPQGVLSTEPLQEIVRTALPAGWPERPVLRLVAVDYESGDRAALTRHGTPSASLPAAVAASCAIPGYYFPVRIRGRRYIDGGLYSQTNLDLLEEDEAEVVVCLSPMTSTYRGGWLEPTGPLASLVRGDPSARLAAEVAALKAAGKRVLLLQPRAEDVRLMGYNYMSPGRARQVIEAARRTTVAALRGTRLGAELSSLGRPLRAVARRASAPPAHPAARPA